MFKRIISVALATVMAFTLVSCKDGDKDESYRIIKLVSFEGRVVYTRDDKTNDVYKNMNFESGDSLKTGEQANATLSLDSDKTVTLSENTEINMKAEGDEDDSRTCIELKSGEILNEIKEPLKSGALYEVKTSNATIGVKGTTFLVKAEGEKTIVYCEKGTVEVKSEENTEEITASQAVVVEDGTVSAVPVEDVKNAISDTIKQKLWGETYGITNIPEGWSVEKTASGEYILTNDSAPNNKRYYDADGMLTMVQAYYPDDDDSVVTSCKLVDGIPVTHVSKKYSGPEFSEETLIEYTVHTYTKMDDGTTFKVLQETYDGQTDKKIGDDYTSELSFSLASNGMVAISSSSANTATGYLGKLVFGGEQVGTDDNGNTDDTDKPLATNIPDGYTLSKGESIRGYVLTNNSDSNELFVFSEEGYLESHSYKDSNGEYVTDIYVTSEWDKGKMPLLYSASRYSDAYLTLIETKSCTYQRLNKNFSAGIVEAKAMLQQQAMFLNADGHTTKDSEYYVYKCVLDDKGYVTIDSYSTDETGEQIGTNLPSHKYLGKLHLTGADDEIIVEGATYIRDVEAMDITYKLYKQSNGLYTLENDDLRCVYTYNKHNTIRSLVVKSADGKTYTEYHFLYQDDILPIFSEAEVFDSSTDERVKRIFHLPMAGSYDESSNYNKADYAQLEAGQEYIYAFSISEYDGVTEELQRVEFYNLHATVNDKAVVRLSCTDIHTNEASFIYNPFISDVSQYI